MTKYPALLGALFCSLVSLTSADAAALEKPDISIAVGGKVALYYLPLTIAESKGYFRDEGLNVRVLDFQGGSASVQAVAGGSADILSSAFEHTINLQARGQPLTAFVLQGRFPGFVLSVSPELAKTYKSPADLAHKRIGVTAPGSSTNAMLNRLLSKSSLTPDDVSVIGVGAGATVLAAFENKRIDATVQADPATTLLVTAGDAIVKVDTRTAEGTALVYGGPMPGASLSALKGFIDQNPNTIQALTNAMVHALRFLKAASDEEILAAIPPDNLLGGNHDLYIKMIHAVRSSYSPDGVISEEAARTALTVIGDDNPEVRSAKIDLSRTYDPRFVANVPKE